MNNLEAAGSMRDRDKTGGPDKADIRTHVVFRLSLFTTIADRNGKVYFHKRFGLTIREYRILGVIGYCQPVSMMRLVAECYLDKGQVSRVVSRLVDGGLVERVADADSGARGGDLILSDKGSVLLDEALKYGDELNDRALSVLSNAERQLFSEHLDRILAHARTMFDETHE